MNELDLANSIHGLHWVYVLACPADAARLSRAIPVQLILNLLDTYAGTTAESLVSRTENGMRVDDDPTGGLRRARPFMILLRQRLEDWTPEIPVPADIVALARQVVEAEGSLPMDKLDESIAEADFEQYLLWPEKHIDDARHRV